MLEELLMHLNNWFVVPDGIRSGDFSIQSGSISLPFLRNGQYFRVVGSSFNDGLHQYPDENMIDEDFRGFICGLSIPKELISLSAEIEAWKNKNTPSSFSSESFGGYSYSKTTDSSGAPADWPQVFRQRLNKFRKIRDVSFVFGSRQ